jgi:Prealbumin-like fold domain
MKRLIGPKGNRRWRRLLVAPLLLPIVLGLMLIGLAQAAPDDNGLFELDANVHDQAAAGDDWSNIFNNTDSAFTDTGIVADPAPQSIFTGGGSKDDLDIPQWQHKDGNVPDKDDITNAYAAAYTSGGDTFVYFGLDRFAVQGSANVGFWFLQDDVAPIPGTPPGSTSTFSGEHEVGDLLVLSEFDQGGGGVSIKVLEWVGTGGDEGGGTLQTLFGGDTGLPADCDTTPTTANVCANVNTAPLLDADIPWDYVGKGGVRNMPTAAFFEGGINLSALLPDEPCITNMVAETRSSFEVNAVLKDLVHANFQLCNANISIGPSAVNEVGDEHTFDVTVNKTVAGTETPADDGTIVTVTLTDQNGDPITPTGDTCAFPGTVGGTCSVTFSSDVAGVITGHAEADVVVGGTTFHVETGGTGNNPDATKRFVNGRISINPPTDTNGITENHTLTATVEQDDGEDPSGFDPVSGATVTFTLLNNTAGAVFVPDGANTCVTGALGTCSVQITSSTAGSVDIQASSTWTLDGVELTRTTGTGAPNSGNANKVFVDGTLRWLKHDQDGKLLGGAEFEVCRTHNFNSNSMPPGFDDTPDVCVQVKDDAAPPLPPGYAQDTDPTPGEFQLDDLILGRYTIRETVPPPGYASDPDTETVELTVMNPSNTTNPPVFVNRQLFKVIVVTCNDSVDPEVLVDSTVTLNSEQKETITGVPAHLAAKGVTQADLCAIGGASYGDLPANPNLGVTVELPDVAPLFPPTP